MTEVFDSREAAQEFCLYESKDCDGVWFNGFKYKLGNGMELVMGRNSFKDSSRRKNILGLGGEVCFN